MTTKPIIALACRTADSVDDPDVPVPCKNELCLNTYIQAVIKSGGIPILLPSTDTPDIYLPILQKVDGVFLPGGNDIDPVCYGEVKSDKSGMLRPSTDKLDAYLIQYCLDRKVPLLGICRGMQMMNVVLGGRLAQDMGARNEQHDRHDGARDALAHTLKLTAQTKLHAILGGVSTVQTNSLHHQEIMTLGHNLSACARSEDETIEAIELDGQQHPFFIGIQSHPEELYDHPDLPWKNLFDGFVDACKKSF